MKTSFTFAGMPHLLFGAGQLGMLAGAVRPYGQNVLLLTGANALARNGHLARIAQDLEAAGIRVQHRRVCGEPSPAAVDDIVAAIRGTALDLVVAVGGGSVLDAGKAVAAMLCEEGSVADYLEGVGRRQPSGRSLPLIAMPTTSGTGSEATKNAVISQVGEDGFKKSLRHDNYIPKLAILDPLLCLSAPSSVTAACGMDALTQLIEAYVSTQASPLTDALARDGLKRMIPALPEVCGAGGERIDLRGDVAFAAFLSGVTLAHAGLCVIHGVAGPMGGLVAIPHGVACANLLPPAVAATVENLSAAATAEAAAALFKFARIGRWFGAPYDDPMDACRFLVDRLYGWLDLMAIPRLGRFGLTAFHVDRLVGLSSNKNNPLPLSADQIRRMLLERC